MKPYTLRCENANLIQEMKKRNRTAARPIRWIGSISLRQKGFTLVELLVTVAIIVFLTVCLFFHCTNPTACRYLVVDHVVARLHRSVTHPSNRMRHGILQPF